MADPAPAHPGSPSRAVVERHDSALVLGGHIQRADVPLVGVRARLLLAETDGDPVPCDVSTLRADLAAVDAVAGLALAARRLDRVIRLRAVPPALRELLALAGLADVVRCEPGSGLDPRG